MTPHGTYSRYTNKGCRCLRCKKAATKAQHEKYLKRRGDLRDLGGRFYGRGGSPLYAKNGYPEMPTQEDLEELQGIQ